MAHLEARREQPRPPHADPRRAAGSRRPVPGGPAARALPGRRPWEGRIVEAPALLRHNGTFYLMYSAGRCCGRRCTYATGVARSATLLGPWEKRPAPVLTGGNGIRCPGHVGTTRGPTGGLVLAFHAYVRGDTSNRQLLTAPLDFDAAGWPRVARPGRVVPQPPAQHYEFGAELSRGWEWPATARAPASRVDAGRLVLGRGILTRQTGTTRFSARAVVAEGSGRARPGLAAMSSDGNTVAIELRGRRAVAWRRDDNRLAFLGGVPVRKRAVELRVDVAGTVRLAVRTGGPWRSVGGIQPLPRWSGGAHVALRVDGPPGARAQFESLSIDPR